MKQRADIQLVECGLTTTRSKAKLLIQSGVVFEGERAIKKAGELVSTDDLRVVEEFKFVGRGGLKLEEALNVFQIDLDSCVIADIGASTGGFTDCCLQNGARKVYAIDVGHGQLDPKLCSHSQVVNLEKTNIRNLDSLDEVVDYCVADLSYISLRLVLEKMFSLLKDGGKCITLFKPQFEAGKENVGKGGIVKESLHEELLDSFYQWSWEQKIYIENVTVSPIKGKHGNREFLLLLSKNQDDTLNEQRWRERLEEIL